MYLLSPRPSQRHLDITMRAFVVVMAAAAVVTVTGKPTSHREPEGDGEGHMGEGHMGGDSMEGSWGWGHGKNCSMKGSWGMRDMEDGAMMEGMGHMSNGSMDWGMKRKGNCSMPTLPMVFQKMHVMHLCDGKPEEHNCSARAHHCMDWLDLGMGNGQDFTPKDDVCEEGDAECPTMYQECLDLLTPAEGTSEVSPVSVICAVQDHPNCLTRMPECVAKLYPGRAAPIMPAEGKAVCHGHEDMGQCMQMVRECRQMMMAFTTMLMKMGPEGMMSMLPDGMEHDGMMPHPEPEPMPEPMAEGMDEGMPIPPACRDFMNECMMMMRPGPDGPISEAEACLGMEGGECSKKYSDCHALMSQAQQRPPPEMPMSAQHLCKQMPGSMREACVPAATVCHEKLKPSKPLMKGNMMQCLTHSSPCPKFPSSPEEHTSLKKCMEPVLRAHIGNALMIPLEDMGTHGSESSTASQSPSADHDTAAYNACFHDNSVTMKDVVKCAMKQCIKEGMKGM